MSGYSPDNLSAKPDCIVIGNAISRGNPEVEYILNQGLPFCSGPQWLRDHILTGRSVIAVAGTHGKTTVTSMLTTILEHAGFNPGFLIGGVPNNFGISARLGDSPYFVIEADEYDSAFFDKRSKFIHYRPNTLVINNLEFDHADIFASLDAIKKQFQHVIKTVPGKGTIIYPRNDHNITDVLEQGYWSELMPIGNNTAWATELIEKDGSEFAVCHKDDSVARVCWSEVGLHNVQNGLTAIVASMQTGIPLELAAAGLSTFTGVKRRLQERGQVNGITVYDDFAHHPTAIATTIHGLKTKVGNERVIAVLEFASNTMLSGYHNQRMASVFADADKVILLKPKNASWSVNDVMRNADVDVELCDSVDSIIDAIAGQVMPSDHVLVMSNRSFDNLHERLLARLNQ